jgi:MFS family permease
MAEENAVVGYGDLVRNNSEFRKLWLAQVVSNMGDWFNNVAVLGLVWALTGSGMAASLVILSNTVPSVVITPVAGVVLDRLDRRKVMIAADLIRAVLALGFLLVHRPDQVWMTYLFGAALVTISAFFQPAMSAAIPRLTTRQELIAANGLSSSTWGLMLAVGAALGGLVTGLLGREIAFFVNALSFLLSAALVWAIRTSLAPDRDESTAPLLSPWREFRDGLRYARRSPQVLALLLVKSGWGIGGGILVLLTVFGAQVFGAGDLGIGSLYAARGLGVLLGPYLVRPLVGNSFQRMRTAIPIAFFISGTFYMLFSRAPILVAGMVMVIGAHIGGSISWTLSSVMLQQVVPDHLRGRIFAFDSALVTSAIAMSTFVVGWAIEQFDPRVIALLTATVFLCFGVGWGMAIQSSVRKNPVAWTDAVVPVPIESQPPLV